MDGLGVPPRRGFRLREKIHLLGWNEIILRCWTVQRTEKTRRQEAAMKRAKRVYRTCFPLPASSLVSGA